MANDGDFEAAVRGRLKQMRFERGMTQEDVAAGAGLTTSTVSRLESGARRITLAHLQPLSRALGVEVGVLLGGAAAPEPAPASDGKVWWPLSHDSAGAPRAYRIRLPEQLREPALGSHEGQVFFYVLTGRVRLVTAESDSVLNPGDRIEFNTWIPHWVGVVDEAAEVLAIFHPSGRPPRLRNVV